MPNNFATNHIITYTNIFCALICANNYYVCTACGKFSKESIKKSFVLKNSVQL